MKHYVYNKVASVSWVQIKLQQKLTSLFLIFNKPLVASTIFVVESDLQKKRMSAKDIFTSDVILKSLHC